MNATPEPPNSGPQPDSVYKKSENLVTRTIIEDTIIVPISGKLADMQSIFSVESVAAFIWGQIDGARSVHEIQSMVQEHFDVDPKTAESDLQQFLLELISSGLITETDQ